jgi:hypothetical protein
MSHSYSAQGSDGKTYDVTTDEHHTNHTNDSFKSHLEQIIQQYVVGLASGFTILGFKYLGRK